MALECESVRKSEGEQYWQVAVEVKSSTSGSSLKLVQLELKEKENEVRHTEDSGEAGDFRDSQNTGRNGYCQSFGKSLKEEGRKQAGHEENHNDSCSKDGADAGDRSLPSGVTHVIRQSVTSSVFNFSANVTMSREYYSYMPIHLYSIT